MFQLRPAHRDAIMDVAGLDSSPLVVTASQDGKAAVWDIREEGKSAKGEDWKNITCYKVDMLLVLAS